MSRLSGKLAACAPALAMAACLGFPWATAAAEDTAAFTVDVKPGDTPMALLQVTLNCFEGGDRTLSARIPPGESRSFSIPIPSGRSLNCLLGALPIPGQRLAFRGDGGSEVELTGEGCLFSGVQAGHANFCQIEVEQEHTSLTVYKKWIGTADPEPDVEIRLLCNDGEAPESRQINQDRPGGWKLQVTDPDGLECDVFERERDDFRADISDCQDLIVRPGAREECTMVNTKVVKMIQMLNRYGLFVMIGVFAIAGMVAARRMMP
jgi:hypothetical protein